jgi:hypothetical protein
VFLSETKDGKESFIKRMEIIFFFLVTEEKVQTVSCMDLDMIVFIHGEMSESCSTFLSAHLSISKYSVNI